MANYETVIYETVEGKIRRLTLNRPEKLNALSPKLLSELMQVLDVYEEDPDASVLIIRGAGRAFSAGYDLNAPAVPGQKFTISNDRVNMQRLVTGWQRLWSCIKPTIAQVHGFCLAGATEFVGHCDIVFASEDASFGHPAGRNLGVLPTLSLWPVLMGPRKSKELFFTGDTISAAEAVDWHLINRVFPKDKLEVTGFRAAEQSSADLDVIAHQTEAVKEFLKTQRTKGLKEALNERDRPFAKKQA
jgi:enoyl-CoA hydratase